MSVRKFENKIIFSKYKYIDSNKRVQKSSFCPATLIGPVVEGESQQSTHKLDVLLKTFEQYSVI